MGDRMTSDDPQHPAGHGSLASGVKSDPRSRKLDRLFFRRIWDFCRPYWTRKGGSRSYVLLALLIGLGLAATAAGGMTTLLYKEINNAVVAKDAAGYWGLTLKYIGLGGAVLAATILATFVEGYLKTDWRRWMTARLMDEYLGHRTYYAITLDGDIDNPDQRIQEEVKPVIDAFTGIPSNILNTSMNVTVQVAILATIAMPLLVATLAYCTVNAFLTYFINKPTIKQNWDSTVAEADLRFGLLSVRTNAETIAFYRGENGERVHLTQRLARAIATQWALLRYQAVVSVATSSVGLVWRLLPALLVVPLYFSGQIEFGVIAAATSAATMINVSVSSFIEFIPMMIKAVPHVVRVAEIREKHATIGTHSQAQHIGHLSRKVRDDVIGFDSFTLSTPGGERILFSNLSVEVRKGTSLLISGPTGTGKSSVLRAIAGLWNVGHGTVHSPPEDRTVYLPQRPYMVLGSLRQQLLYPGNAQVAPSDEEIVHALREACLEELVQRHPDLSAEADWGRILSLGEQQRIGFARAYLSGAEFIFLDEATSAVDVKTERRLYAQLLSRRITLISVGHRASLYGYHDFVLDLRTDGTGEVMSIERYLAHTSDSPPSQRSAV